MSDHDLGKKLVEEEELQPFLDEYASVTGMTLRLSDRRGERPDFVCDKQGKLVGLELVQVMRNPTERERRIIMGREEQIHGSDAAMLVQKAVYEKEAKRSSAGWRYAELSILVVQLRDSVGADVAKYLNEHVMNEMSATGFIEIWIADYTVMEPYGTVQLLGVKPARWRGLHRHRFYGMKPYG